MCEKTLYSVIVREMVANFYFLHRYLADVFSREARKIFWISRTKCGNFSLFELPPTPEAAPPHSPPPEAKIWLPPHCWSPMGGGTASPPSNFGYGKPWEGACKYLKPVFHPCLMRSCLSIRYFKNGPFGDINGIKELLQFQISSGTVVHTTTLLIISIHSMSRNLGQ